jgi:hypothetical protein
MLGKLPKLQWGRQKGQSRELPAQVPASKEGDSNAVDQSEILLNDPAEKKRLQACNHVRDTATLLRVSREDKSDRVKIAAARQYARSLDASAETRSLLKGYANTPADRRLALFIAAQHADPQIRAYGLSLFDQDRDFTEIAIETRFHDTRDQVTEKIGSLTLIDDVYRQIKTKDKVVARKLKERLQAHQSHTAQLAEQHAEIDKIIEQMDKLAHGAWAPNFSNRYDLFLNRWQALDFEISSEEQQRFESLRQVAAEKVDQNREAQAQQESLQADITRLDELVGTLSKTELSALKALLPGVATETHAIRTKWTTDASRPSDDAQLMQALTGALKRADAAYSQAASASQSHAQVQEANTADIDQLKSHKAALRKAIELQGKGKTEASYTDELPALLQSVEQKIKALNEAHAELKTGIQKQFGSLNSAINASKWGPAKSIYERLEKKIARLPAADRNPLHERLGGFEKRLTELGDWKQFAVEPKLETLCEEMEQLPSRQLPPRDQADRIKELQNQWKAMGASPSQETYWPRFKAAADIAYAPCAEYFAKRREDKAQKLEQREAILSMLKDYTEQVNWDNPDWRLVEKTIRTAKNEWRKLRVHDRKAVATQEDAFTEVLATLNSKLEPAYEQGAAEKEALIERVKTLGEGEVNQHCINQVKRLQSQWRRTGIVRRADDQRLWKAFNQACSDVYDVHRGKQKEQYDASMEHVKRARAIIKTLREYDSDNKPLDEKKLQALQDEFEGLPEFPERDQKFLFRDFNRALAGLDKQRELHTESAHKAQLARLRSNASLCDQLESLLGQPPAAVTTRIEQLLGKWDDSAGGDRLEWKKAINLRRDSVVAHLQSGTLPDLDANTRARRLLCIDLEILLDRETPEEDKGLRMQHQLDQLQQGLSSAQTSSREQQTQALEMKWLTAFPAHEEEREKLNTRFATALAR